jgi:hypothetical protein
VLCPSNEHVAGVPYSLEEAGGRGLLAVAEVVGLGISVGGMLCGQMQPMPSCPIADRTKVRELKWAEGGGLGGAG